MGESELHKGLEVVRKAIAHDNDNNLQEAAYLYDLAVELFQTAFKNETDAQKQAVIYENTERYIERSKQIKQILHPQAVAAASYIEGGVSAATLAQDLDAANRYKEAATQYETAAQLFSIALRSETDDDVKETLKERIAAYKIRGEQIKQQLQGSTSNITFGLQPGQKYYDPMPKQTLLNRLKNHVTR